MAIRHESLEMANAGFVKHTHGHVLVCKEKYFLCSMKSKYLEIFKLD